VATRAQPVKIGPFTGGLNIYSDASTIGDSECTDINNFDIDLDGTLKSRPPVVMATGPSTVGCDILGFFTWTDGVVYIIASDGITTTYAYNTNTLAWSTITATFAASSMAQFANKALVVSPTASANPSGSWDPVAGFVAIATMPKGTTCTIYKERMYIATGVGNATPSRLFFCPPSNPTGVWNTGTDYLDVNNGDGQDIIEIITFNNALIIFKRNSTYMFAYDSAPTKGTVQLLINNIGVSGKNCVVVFENYLYIMYQGKVYSVMNWNWFQLNVKVPFVYLNTHAGLTHIDQYICTINNRLICKYFDIYYVYGFKTRVWSKWTFSADAQLLPNKFWKFPVADPTTGVAKFFAGSALTTVVAAKSLQILRDTYTVTESEVMNISVRSKTYNFNVPYSYKRLFWWGIDVLTNSLITARVIPISYGQPVTWDQLSGYTWDQLATATWNAPIDIPLDVSDSADIHNTSGVRMFVKLLKSLRFRQIAFDISSIVDGTTTTGPFRLFSITAFVANKELSNKKIN
jgi:hypothetical protein